MKIAVCITTRNRHETFKDSLYHHGKFRPDRSMLFVVDDASDSPVRVGGYFHRFENNVGIPRAKNKCLELAYNSGADHIFLFDDDCYPIAHNWWRPYVEHKESHLMYQFKLPGRGANDMKELYRDEATIAYSHTRGAMIYVERKVLEVVGGMDVEFGLGRYEHTDWTNRIHNADLTTYRAMDVPESNKLIYCLDQDSKVESSISYVRGNRGYYFKQKNSKAYKEFR